MSKYAYSCDEENGLDTISDSKSKSGITVMRLGGELISYRIFDPSKNKLVPVLYRDGLWEPQEDAWKNHATILFPIVGGLKNKSSVYKGQTKISSKGNHGFARHSVFTFAGKEISENSASLRYTLVPNDEIRGYYPFEFKLDLVYTISGNGLTVEFIVENKEGERVLPFSIGWHPGIKAPLIDNQGRKTDCQLLMNKGEYIHVKCNEESRLTGEKERLSVEGPFPWTEEELDHTIMLSIDHKENRSVVFHDPNTLLKLHFDFADFPYLGYWANQGENFICVEPWQGLDDHEEQEPFENKVGLVELEPGQIDKRKVIVTPKFE